MLARIRLKLKMGQRRVGPTVQKLLAVAEKPNRIHLTGIRTSRSSENFGKS